MHAHLIFFFSSKAKSRPANSYNNKLICSVLTRALSLSSFAVVTKKQIACYSIV